MMDAQLPLAGGKTMGLKEWIVPQEKHFFDLLEEDAKTVAEGARALLDLLRDFRDVKAKRKHVKDIGRSLPRLTGRTSWLSRATSTTSWT